VDPTVRFETNECQPVDVDKEKKEIYEPVCDELMKKYNIKFKIEVIGLLVGARGVIFKDFHTLSKPLNLPKKLIYDIALTAVKGSVRILHSHLYASSNNL